MIKQIPLLVFFLSLSTICTAIEKSEFYKVIASGNILEVDKCLQDLKSDKKSSKINAYTGVVMMKKASFVKDPKEKLKLFSTGAEMLNNEISKDSTNLEFRFLRLIFQEKAPKFLGYNKDIKSDKKQIIKGYKKMDAGLQREVLYYSKKSKILTTTELQ